MKPGHIVRYIIEIHCEPARRIRRSAATLEEAIEILYAEERRLREPIEWRLHRLCRDEEGDYFRREIDDWELFSRGDNENNIEFS